MVTYLVSLQDCRWPSSVSWVRSVPPCPTWETRRTGGWSSPPAPSPSSTPLRWCAGPCSTIHYCTVLYAGDIGSSPADLSRAPPSVRRSPTRSSSGRCTGPPMTWTISSSGEKNIEFIRRESEKEDRKYYCVKSETSFQRHLRWRLAGRGWPCRMFLSGNFSFRFWFSQQKKRKHKFWDKASGL